MRGQYCLEVGRYVDDVIVIVFIVHVSNSNIQFTLLIKKTDTAIQTNIHLMKKKANKSTSDL